MAKQLSPSTSFVASGVLPPYAARHAWQSASATSGVVCATCALKPLQQVAAATLTAATASLLLTLAPACTHAVSGGGRDYASQNHSNETFSGDYSTLDFSGGLFRNSIFRNAVLRSASFFKAELRDTDLSGADLSFATIEAAILRDADLSDAVLNSAYISDSVLDVRSIRGADFTDALITPASVVAKLCEREDASGINSITGVATRESLMCPD